MILNQRFLQFDVFLKQMKQKLELYISKIYIYNVFAINIYLNIIYQIYIYIYFYIY